MLKVFKNQFFLVFILSLIGSFIIFGNTIKGDFVFDDVVVVKNRGDLKDYSYFLNLFISPYHQNVPKTGLYRPLTMASYSLNHNIIGSEPAGFHIVNIIIHALNSFLVFWLVNYFLKNKNIAYFSFFLFLAHPIHTEAVSSVVGRAELLAFFWSLITIYYFTKGFKFLSSIAFFFGLLSKETTLILLPLLFYIDLYFNKNDIFKAIRRQMIFVVPFGSYSILRYIALGKYFAGDISTTIVENQLKFASFYERIFTALKVLYMYVERLIWPIHLSADYSYRRISLVKKFFTSYESLIGMAMLLLLLWAAFRYWKNKQELALGAVFFLFPYLIISNLIIPIGTIMGERLMYFPSLGFVVLLAIYVNKLNRKMSYIALAAILIFFSVRTIIRNKDWKDGNTLFFATVKESPNSLIVRTALAGIYIRNNEWEKANEELELARAIHEDNSHLQNLLGIAADHSSDYTLAEKRFKKSVELNPDAINSYINLAEMYLKQNKYEEAGRNFLKVIKFFPVAEYLVRYAYTQIAINNPDEAINVLNKYAGGNLKHPDFSVAMGTAYFVKKDYSQALFYLENAQKHGNKLEEVENMIVISRSKLNGK